MGFLLDNLPPTVRLIIATAPDPPLHLSQRDLRFSVEDAEACLKQVMSLELTAADASEWVKRPLKAG